MSNRQVRRMTRMSQRLTRIFGKDISISWRGSHRVSLNWGSTAICDDAVHVDFIGNQYIVYCELYNFHWKGERLADAAHQLKLIRMVAG